MEKMNAKGDEGGEPGKGKDDIDPEVSENEYDMENEDEAEAIDETSETQIDRGGDESLDNVEDEGKDMKKVGGDNHKNRHQEKFKTKNSMESKMLARKKAAALLNAQRAAQNSRETYRVDLSMDQVARGKARYGSN
jgi:hypothetical protein